MMGSSDFAAAMLSADMMAAFNDPGFAHRAARIPNSRAALAKANEQ